MEKENIIAAFQVWDGQTSAFYSIEASPLLGLTAKENKDRLTAFIRSHYESRTFAALLTFTSLEEAKKKWNEIHLTQNIDNQ